MDTALAWSRLRDSTRRWPIPYPSPQRPGRLPDGPGWLHGTDPDPGPGPGARDAVVVALRAAGCVFAEDEARLIIEAARSGDHLDAMVARRVAGLPLEHILGWAAFCGVRVAVQPGVFVPRRRTGLLVREAIGHVRGTVAAGPGARAGRGFSADGTSTGGGGPVEPRSVPVLVDLCCGSGAVGAAVAAALGPVAAHAVDIEPAAVRCARRNLAAAGGRAYQGDLYEPLPATLRGRVDVLIANAPYVPTDALGLMPPEAREHEPRVALDGGTDGLDVLRRVVAGAPDWLAPRGCLLVETSQAQAPALARYVAGAGLAARVVSDDELGATALVVTRPQPPGR